MTTTTELRQHVGIRDLPFDAYLATPAVSKSSLWTLHDRSPAHARVEKEESNAMKMGTAVHCAILEPSEFEARFVRGPEDRRGNKWKDALDAAASVGRDLLTSGDYDDALAIRDRLRNEPLVKKLVGPKTVREISAFAIDPVTGLLMRARPDARRDDIALTVDLKITTDCRAPIWSRRVADFGYHAQDSFYRDVWAMAAEGSNHNPETAAFVFLVVEPKPPYEFAVYEIDAEDLDAGRKAMRSALDRWAECQRTGAWPGYARSIETIRRPAWVRRAEETEQEVEE